MDLTRNQRIREAIDLHIAFEAFIKASTCRNPGCDHTCDIIINDGSVYSGLCDHCACDAWWNDVGQFDEPGEPRFDLDDDGSF
jgi:hypothetical protein